MIAKRQAPSPASCLCAALALLLGACVGPAPVNAPRPPEQVTVVQGPPPPADWHDLPASAGIWQWSRADSTTIARFGASERTALFSMICDRQAGMISLVRTGTPGPATTMAIRTTTLTRILSAQSGSFGMTATLSASDPLLDAMAYSRGRFAVEVPGSASLYVPSWPEVSRVIEDCRVRPTALPTGSDFKRIAPERSILTPK